jgi:hypothetical protein
MSQLDSDARAPVSLADARNSRLLDNDLLQRGSLVTRHRTQVDARLALGIDLDQVVDVRECDLRQLTDHPLGGHLVLGGCLRQRLLLLFALCLDQLIDTSDHVGPVSDAPRASAIRSEAGREIGCGREFSSCDPLGEYFVSRVSQGGHVTMVPVRDLQD